MSTAQGELRLLKPEIYQEVNGAHHQVSGRYVLKGDNRVGFAVANGAGGGAGLHASGPKRRRPRRYRTKR